MQESSSMQSYEWHVQHFQFKTPKYENQTKTIQNIYISTIFLYNSELWSLTLTEEKRIDSFHRRILRKAINRAWPKRQYTNEQLYEITEEKPWSKVIQQRRLRWTGHMLRMPENTPARQAIMKYTEKHLNKVGRPRNTWFKTVRRDIDPEKNLVMKNDRDFLKYLTEIASDKEHWRSYVEEKCSMVRKDWNCSDDDTVTLM